MWYLKLHKHLGYIVVSSSPELASKKNFILLELTFDDKKAAMDAAVRYLAKP